MRLSRTVIDRVTPPGRWIADAERRHNAARAGCRAHRAGAAKGTRELDISRRADKDGGVRKRWRPARVLTMCLALGVLAACAAPVVTLEPGPRAFTPEDYEDVYDRWTRTARPFDFGRLSTVLNLTATFESREFRWAYVVRYGRDFGLTTDARYALLTESLRDAGQHHRFFVTLGGAHPRDLNLAEESGAWRVLLMDDRGRQTRPLEVRHVRRPSPGERRYFPSISTQRQTFRLVFPVLHEDGNPTLPRDSQFALLRFTGSEGQVDLKWEFAQP